LAKRSINGPESYHLVKYHFSGQFASIICCFDHLPIVFHRNFTPIKAWIVFLATLPETQKLFSKPLEWKQ